MNYNVLKLVKALWQKQASKVEEEDQTEEEDLSNYAAGVQTPF